MVRRWSKPADHRVTRMSGRPGSPSSLRSTQAERPSGVRAGGLTPAIPTGTALTSGGIPATSGAWAELGRIDPKQGRVVQTYGPSSAATRFCDRPRSSPEGPSGRRTHFGVGVSQGTSKRGLCRDVERGAGEGLCRSLPDVGIGSPDRGGERRLDAQVESRLGRSARSHRLVDDVVLFAFVSRGRQAPGFVSTNRP